MVVALTQWDGGSEMEPLWSLKGSQKRQHFDNISNYIFTLFFSLECEVSHKNQKWQRFDNIFRTFWKWQCFDNILTTFWQHFLKKYLRRNELIMSHKLSRWAPYARVIVIPYTMVIATIPAIINLAWSQNHHN